MILLQTVSMDYGLVKINFFPTFAESRISVLLLLLMRQISLPRAFAVIPTYVLLLMSRRNVVVVKIPSRPADGIESD